MKRTKYAGTGENFCAGTKNEVSEYHDIVEYQAKSKSRDYQNTAQSHHGTQVHFTMSTKNKRSDQISKRYREYQWPHRMVLRRAKSEQKWEETMYSTQVYSNCIT